MWVRKLVQLLGLVLFCSLCSCGKYSADSVRNADEVSVLAQSSFYAGETAPNAEQILLQTRAVTGGEGGFISGPNGHGGNDGGAITQPGTPAPPTSTPPAPPAAPTQSNPPTVTQTDPTTPTAPAPTENPVAQNPPAPVAPAPTPTPTPDPTDVVGPMPAGGSDGGMVQTPPNGGGNDTGTVGPTTGGGTVTENPPSNTDGSGTSGGSTDPGSNESGGTVAQNPPDQVDPNTTTGNTDNGATGGTPAPGGNDGGVAQNPRPDSGTDSGNGGGTGLPPDQGVPLDPPAGDGTTVVQVPPPVEVVPAPPGDAPATTPDPQNPGSSTDGGAVASNPADAGNADGGVAPQPGNTQPNDGGVAQTPPTGSNPGDTTPGTPTAPSTGDGTVAQNPPPADPGGSSDGGTTPVPNDSGSGDGGVAENPNGSGNGDGGTSQTPGNGTGNGDGTVAQNPGPSGDGSGTQNPGGSGSGSTDGEIGGSSCTEGINVVINRVCSERRSAIAYPQFVFFEEARNPILTLETTVEVTQNRNRNQLASMGGGQLHPMESTLLNILLNPFRGRRTTEERVAIGRAELSHVDLRTGKYRARLNLAINTIKQWYPRTWRNLWIDAAVCDDRNQDGFCKGEREVNQLLAVESGFRLGRIPRELKLMVWNGRSKTLAADPGSCEEQYSPLVLDLAGDGFRFSGPEDGVFFDLNDTGEGLYTGWTAGRDDAFLVRDLNGNRRIDSGAELFGSATKLANGDRASNGFLALAPLDSNANGIIDSKDREWKNLWIWLDYDHDGVSERGELYTPSEAQLESISLAYVDSLEIDEYGNETRQRSTFRRRAGGRSVALQVIDVWFSTFGWSE